MENNSCQYHEHPVWGKVVYILSGAALFLHMLGHLVPVLIVFGEPGWAEKIAHNPWLTAVALSFIPLAIYHIWRDRKIHAELHRLQEIEKEFIRATELNNMHKFPARSIRTSRLYRQLTRSIKNNP
jgi:hypothetical protein